MAGDVIAGACCLAQLVQDLHVQRMHSADALVLCMRQFLMSRSQSCRPSSQLMLCLSAGTHIIQTPPRFSPLTPPALALQKPLLPLLALSIK